MNKKSYVNSCLNRLYKLLIYSIFYCFSRGDAVGHSIYYMVIGYKEPEVGTVYMVDKNNIQVFNTGKVIDLETTAALIPEITLMYHGEKYKFQDHVFIVKGGEDDSVKYLVYDELNDSLFCVVEKKLPNSQWLREKYRLVSSTEASELKPYLRYIQNENDWVYIQKR